VGPCGVVPRYAANDVTDLLTASVAHDVEGVVLKRLGYRYYPGERRRCWRKVKAPGWAAVHGQRRRPQ
jgi:ATP-dependent DNA ligase